MNFTLVVIDQGIERVIDSGLDQIFATFNIVDENDEVVDNKRFGFAADTTPEEVQAELQKYLDLYKAEAEAKPAREKLDKEQEATQATVDSLKDLEITATVEEDPPADSKPVDTGTSLDESSTNNE